MRPVGAVVEPSIFHFFLVLARETLCYINAGFASLKPGVAAFLFGPGCSILFLKTFIAERLESVEDPEVACLLLQAEVATVIPNGFLSRTSLTRLDLSAESIVTHIGDCFLANCTSLTSVDLSGLSNVMQVGAWFLQHCSSLTTLDISALSNVTLIDGGFLYGCKSLTNVHLSPLSNLTHVGAHFLQECISLTTLDLSPLSNVTHISSGLFGTNIVAGCTSLASIYLSGCSSVVSNEVRKGEKLRKLVVEARPKRSRDESPEQSQKRRRHAQ